LAEQWLALIPEKTAAPALRTRAEAAILEARGDFPGAKKKLAECEHEIQTHANPVYRERALPLLRRWQAEVEQKLSASPGCA